MEFLLLTSQMRSASRIKMLRLNTVQGGLQTAPKRRGQVGDNSDQLENQYVKSPTLRLVGSPGVHSQTMFGIK